MICAECTETIPDDASVCPHCGEEPLLDGSYVLEDVVGHGANGTTYRARRLYDDSTVAIKELLVRKVESLKAIDLFQREARVLEQLDHPGIPGFLDDLNLDAGRSVALYLVQDFIDGETLADEFDRRRATPNEVFELAAELLDTLAYMHGLSPPVVHRDIKPANIMRRGSDGRLVLIDFGSVRDAVDTAEGGSTVAGTFGYMAPEQFTGHATPATDIYGVGATIVALLARQDPQHLIGPDRSIDWEGKLGLSTPTRSILKRMLQPDPNERAADAAALATEIRRALAGDWVPSGDEQSLANRSPAASDAMIRRVRLDAIPPAPRELPDRFRKTYAPSTNFSFMFGGIFAAAGVFASVIPVVVAIANGAAAFAPMSLLFLLIFGGIGGFTLRQGFRRLGAVTRAYEQGEPVAGTIVGISYSNYSVNKQRATVYEYEFVAPNGTMSRGEFHSWEPMDLVEGDDVALLCAPGDPKQNVLWDPAQYRTRRLLRRELRERSTADRSLARRENTPDEEEAPAPSHVDQSW